MPPGVQILSISCSFLGKFGKIICWRPLPPPRGNPGSTTDIGYFSENRRYFISMKHIIFRTVCVSGTFNLFDVFNIVCEQHHRNSFNPLLNGQKNGEKTFTCEPGLHNLTFSLQIKWKRFLLGKYFAISSHSHSLLFGVNKPLNGELQRKSSLIPFKRRFTFNVFCVCVIRTLSDPGN